ncbi:hypothetical protein NCCP2495_32030 [Dietzia sp. NCCP-2495]|uniref:DUF3558 family protein n=1 Tax=Dietzia sp. NCCP-2495 TaxID=2934675 RepID=UPI00222E7647|nr:DUF3558 family protein [Dietzia sp. NCCP-2495]GLB65323.1 hypothetical protein NCCP2495_32030 [Dietzia sp. NCCP-2495]
MAEMGGIKGNRVRRWDVVKVVGKSRAVGAALAAAVLVLSGCGTRDGEDTTTAATASSATEQSGSPWDLPLEQRPALFNPCTEIPIAAIEQGLGGPVTPVDAFENHRPGDLMSCGWRAEEADLTVLSTWKSREEYRTDRSFDVVSAQEELNGRVGMRLLDAIGDPDRSCLQLFFTERGTAWVQVHLTNPYKELDGQRLPNACVVIDQFSQPIMEYLPKGDFQ